MYLMLLSWGYIIFKINAKEIKIERVGYISYTYDEFLKQLPDNDCRYAVHNFQYFAGGIIFWLAMFISLYN